MPVARIEDVVTLAQSIGADVGDVDAKATTALTNANTAITTANAAAAGTAHDFVADYTAAKS